MNDDQRGRQEVKAFFQEKNDEGQDEREGWKIPPAKITGGLSMAQTQHRPPGESEPFTRRQLCPYRGEPAGVFPSVEAFGLP